MIQVSVNYDKTMDDGLPKKVTEIYLSAKETCSEAEKHILEELAPFISGECDVTATGKVKYHEVLLDDGETFFKVKLSFITLDEKSGKEKEKKFTYLARANDLQEAIKNVNAFMKGSMMDYKFVSVAETSIVDYFG